MKKVICTVNAEQVGDGQKKSLETALRSNYARHICAKEKLTIVWCELPANQGFTNYEQPCVSLVVIEAPDDLEQTVREQMLSDCATDWSKVTGSAPERLMITVFDASEFAFYMAANQRRLSLAGRIRFALHMATSFIRSKARRGLLVFNANLGG